MDILLLQLGHSACEAGSMLVAVKGRCADYATMRLIGYILLGMLMLLGSFAALSRKRS